MICPICKMPLVGFKCSVEEHNSTLRELSLYGTIGNYILSDEEIEAGLESPPVQTSEYFEERAMKAMREAGKRRAVKLN